MLHKVLLILFFLPLTVLAEPMLKKKHQLGEIIAHTLSGQLLSLQTTYSSGTSSCHLLLTWYGKGSEQIDSVSGKSCSAISSDSVLRGWLNQTGDVGYLKPIYAEGSSDAIVSVDYILRKADGTIESLFTLPDKSTVSTVATSRGSHHYVLLRLEDHRYRLATYNENRLIYDLTFDYQIGGPTAVESDFVTQSSDILPDGRILLTLQFSATESIQRTALVGTDGTISLLPEDARLDYFEYSYQQFSNGFPYISESGTVYFRKDGKTYRSDLAGPAVEFRPYEIDGFYDENSFVRKRREANVFVSPLTHQVLFEACFFSRADWNRDSSPSLTNIRLFRQNDQFLMTESSEETVITIPNDTPDNFCTELLVRPKAECRENFRKLKNGDLAIRHEFRSKTRCSFTGQLLNSSGEPLQGRTISITEFVPAYGKATGVPEQRMRTTQSGIFRFKGVFSGNSTGLQLKAPINESTYRLDFSLIGFE